MIVMGKVEMRGMRDIGNNIFHLGTLSSEVKCKTHLWELLMDRIFFFSKIVNVISKDEATVNFLEKKV